LQRRSDRSPHVRTRGKRRRDERRDHFCRRSPRIVKAAMRRKSFVAETIADAPLIVPNRCNDLARTRLNSRCCARR
jgi:hypothetical protein